jgi:hypothetical protein
MANLRAMKLPHPLPERGDLSLSRQADQGKRVLKLPNGPSSRD